MQECHRFWNDSAEKCSFEQLAAEASEAAAAQDKFWEMNDTLFRADGLTDRDLVMYAAQLGLDFQRVAEELATGVYTRRVRDDFRGGVRSGVNGTPTFFINGLRYDGNWADTSEFIQILTDAATQVQTAAS